MMDQLRHVAIHNMVLYEIHENGVYEHLFGIMPLFRFSSRSLLSSVRQNPELQMLKDKTSYYTAPALKEL